MLKPTLLTLLLACAFLAPTGCDEAPPMEEAKKENKDGNE